jgi:penicillin amidase
VETFATVQTDTVSLFALEMLPFLQHELLDGWNGDLAADSPAACLFKVWVKHMTQALLEPELGPELYQRYLAVKGSNELPRLLASGDHTAAITTSLAHAMNELHDRLGDDPLTWRWADLHRLRFEHLLSSIDPSLTAGEVGLAGDGTTVCCASHLPDFTVTAGATYRQIADLGDIDRSIATVTHGNAADPDSPHYRDLLPLWSTGRYHPAPQTRPAVEAAAASAAILSP